MAVEVSMIKPFALRSMLMTAITVAASKVHACPYCDSDVGKAVSAGIFNEDFALNTTLTLLPLVVLLTIVWLIHSGFPQLSSFRDSSVGIAADANPKHRQTRGTLDGK